MGSKLHKNAIKSWIISRAIGTVLFLIISLTVFYIMKFKFEIQWVVKNAKYILFGIEIIGLLCIIDVIINPIIEYKTWVYELTSDKIDFTKGILTKKRTIVPIIKIEHIKINRGPINSKLGLANIEIFTAGGSHEIPNIEVKVAEEIGEYLNNKIKEKVEEFNEKNRSL
ncbi:PH domain-containing protein [uncultured Clostridium sp.]|uniref:PH domain-containing protein n=1 Tax=uncultured Clostridium sp. TaxID=59620 RepID=UPI0028E4C446|nr:PH domain-containing protein [uncultured Clostridium sp.]